MAVSKVRQNRRGCVGCVCHLADSTHANLGRESESAAAWSRAAPGF